MNFRICFLQDAVYKGVISITSGRGTENCADLMTKALSRAVTLQRFEIPYDWIGRWCWILEKVSCKNSKNLVIVKFCTSPESEMKAEGERLEGVEVLTITEVDDRTRTDTIEEMRESMLSHKKKGQFVVLWSSILCTGGCLFQYVCLKKYGQDYMSHLRELYRIQKKRWKGLLRLSEVAGFIASEWPKNALIGDGIRRRSF